MKVSTAGCAPAAWMSCTTKLASTQMPATDRMNVRPRLALRLSAGGWAQNLAMWPVAAPRRARQP